VPPPDPARALLVVATLVFVTGLARAVVKRLPDDPQPPWIDSPGVAVELAGDGVYFLDPPATVATLLARADHDCARRVRELPLAPGDRVDVAPRCAVHVTRMPGAARLTLGLPLDPNTDDAQSLSALPGVGDDLAGRIVADRTRRGAFTRLDDLLRVRGLGPATLAKIRKHVRLAPR
jgi:DNA uptake protein ComE-like DNA-binding protein